MPKKPKYLPTPAIVSQQIYPGGAAYNAAATVQGDGLGWSDHDSAGNTWTAYWGYDFFLEKREHLRSLASRRSAEEVSGTLMIDGEIPRISG